MKNTLLIFTAIIFLYGCDMEMPTFRSDKEIYHKYELPDFNAPSAVYYAEIKVSTKDGLPCPDAWAMFTNYANEEDTTKVPEYAELADEDGTIFMTFVHFATEFPEYYKRSVTVYKSTSSKSVYWKGCISFYKDTTPEKSFEVIFPY